MSEVPRAMASGSLLAGLGADTFQLGAYAGGRHLPLAPSFDAQSEPKRGRPAAVFDLGKPALAVGAEAEGDRALLQREAKLGTMLGKIHARYSPEVNIRSSEDIHFWLTDAASPFSDNVNMAAPETNLWHLQEWFATQDKIQRTLITELGWLPAKANKVWHGLQEPKLSEVHEIAALLNIRPHELLMPPEEAFRIRRLEAAVREVAQEAAPATPDAETKKRPGRAA